jgi:hypothetical protein
MKVTRRELWGDPKELHRLLNEPMRANKISKCDRQQWIREQTEARLEALFAEHHIPAEWPELLQWQQLAWVMAGKLYPGCRAIETGRGGTRKTIRLTIEDKKRSLFEKFKTFRPQHHKLNALHAAKRFIQENKEACDAVRLRTPRSFMKAFRSLSK